MNRFFAFTSGMIGLLLLLQCQSPQMVDLIIHNARVYTVDSQFTKAAAFAVDNGKFVAVGSDKEILGKYETREKKNLKGRPVYPGFIDAHCHFYDYGQNYLYADLEGASSYDKVIQRVEQHAQQLDFPWILGWGWDQNKWDNATYPTNAPLNKKFPDTPVLITRIDGHAAIANQKALDIAQVTASTEIEGGIIEKENGQLTGVLIDNAIDTVRAQIPELKKEQKIKSLLNAQEDCFAVGLTTVDDAGLDKPVIDMMDSLQQEGILKMRIYAMANPTETNLQHFLDHGPYRTEHLHVTSFKFFADGALGSRGALLKTPYHDASEQYGLQLKSADYFKEMAKKVYEGGFQMNTHAIGDSANHLMLDIYSDYLSPGNDRRWRIEHAQIVAPEDLFYFDKYNILPSVQPTHATSDMKWADERLGEERLQYAYAYQDLLQRAGRVANGSDFPVETINPLYGFHAAVARQNRQGQPTNGFLPGNALTRTQALKGMTRWAAYANFEEDQKGTITAGKLADFVVLERDIMTIPISETHQVDVSATYVNGEQVYSRE